MKLKVEIFRSDMLLMNLYLVWRSSSNWSSLLFFWTLLTGIYFFNNGFSQSAYTITVTLLWNLVVVFGIIFILLALSIVLTVLSSSKKNGVLGEHEYEIRTNGLFESTEANETLVKWNSIKRIIKSKNYIFIEVSLHLFHIFPRRYFGLEDEFTKFYNEVLMKAESETR